MDRWGFFDRDIWVTIEASVAKSTSKKYWGIIRSFEAFLLDLNRSVDSVRVQDVLSFLQDFVDIQKPASTIRGIYAALTRFFTLHKREVFITQPILKMFVRGAQKLAPLPVKKSLTWDPEIPLRKIASKPRPSTFLEAGREAILLLLLATGIRVDCASKIGKIISFRGEICVLPFLEARKTGISQPLLLQRFEENERVCPVRGIQHFLSLA